MSTPSFRDPMVNLMLNLEELSRVANLKDARVTQLEAETASLRSQLEAAKKARSPAGPSTGQASNATAPSFKQPRAVGRNVSLEQHESLTNKHNVLLNTHQQLEAKYERLKVKHQKCVPYIDDALRKYRAAKESVRQWREYIDRRSGVPRQPATEEAGLVPLSAPPGIDEDDTPRAKRVGGSANYANTDGALPIETANAPFETIPSFHELPAENDNTHRSMPKTPSNQELPRITSSQTTEAESETNVKSSPPGLHRASSGSEPVVVSTRSVKRKRSDSENAMPPPIRIKEEPNSPDQPIDLATGSADYSPVARNRKLARHETSDLDAVLGTFLTPRKNRGAQQNEQRALSEELPNFQSIVQEPSSLSDGDDPASPSKEPAVKVESGATFENSNDRVLLPRSVNVPSKLKSKEGKAGTRRPRDELAMKVNILSEAGEMNQGTSTNERQDANYKATNTPGNQRLLSLLEQPSPVNNVALKRRTPPSANHTTKRPHTPLSNQHTGSKPVSATRPEGKRAEAATTITPLSTRPSTSKARPSAAPAPIRPPRPLGIGASPPPIRPEDEPLRLRPINSLCPDDFKINPKYMGSKYAFADTLRGRENRRCMPGCTKPECCGNAFLKVAEMGGASALSDSKTDEQVLADYLGPNWNELMGAWAPDRRRDLLTQARAHALANQFGKHRQAFERRSTPPGFWRTDMPTTQEEADDRAKAAEMEQGRVEERWREAMREGGRWMFRDE